MNEDFADALSKFAESGIRYRLIDESGQFYLTEDPPPQVPDSSVKLFEAALGRSLPDDFREFIRQYNDASPYDSLAIDETYSPGSFYGLRENSRDSLIGQWGDSREFLPVFTIPIADDVGCGGAICIDLAESTFGQVTSRFADQEPDVIADSFTDFLLLLEVDLR